MDNNLPPINQGGSMQSINNNPDNFIEQTNDDAGTINNPEPLSRGNSNPTDFVF